MNPLNMVRRYQDKRASSRYVSESPISLGALRCISLPEPLEALVICRSGTVWITELDRADDIVLYPGDSYILNAPDTVITAMTLAMIEFRPLTRSELAPAVRKQPEASKRRARWERA